MEFIVLAICALALYFYIQKRDLTDRLTRLHERVSQLELKLRDFKSSTLRQTTLPATIAVAPPEKPGPPPAPDQAPISGRAPAPPMTEPAHPFSPAAPEALSPTPIPVAHQVPQASRRRLSSIDWENFMGVKLFAWLGGFALFLGMAFFVKYSFEHNLISPLLRVIIGGTLGLGAMAGGLWMRNKGYDITVQTLCASGIAILYADIFAAHAFYDLVDSSPSFVLMILVTAASFVLAVRLESRYVAILGLIGGFLTPPLLSTGVDRPITLFSYFALVDAGLIAVALRRRWGFLVAMSAGATTLAEIGWTATFFAPSKAGLALAIYLGFCLLYLSAAEAAHRLGEERKAFHFPAGIMPLVAMSFVFYMLPIRVIGTHPGLILSFLLLFGVPLAYLSMCRKDLQLLYGIGSLVTFGLLALWTHRYLRPDLLIWALGYFLAFALLHTGLPILLQRLGFPVHHHSRLYLSPLAMLVLVLIATESSASYSLVLWPFALMLGILAVTVAYQAGSRLATAGALLLIMACFYSSLFHLSDLTQLTGTLIWLGLFSCLFFAWSLFACGTKIKTVGIADTGLEKLAAQQLPALSLLMPFALLAMTCTQLLLEDPSRVFALMALLVFLLLGLVAFRAQASVALLALGGTVLVEAAWHATAFIPTRLFPALLWYAGFYWAFGLFPFVFRRRIQAIDPWVASALAGPLQFWLILDAVKSAWGETYIGLLPALFAIPSLAGTYYLARKYSAEDTHARARLALMAGVALFFITVIIPLQFHREWITLGFALEGAALIWLYRRLSHEGLRGLGFALLVVAFIRLALNPAVLSYHPRAEVPLLNWYLFVYGAAAVGMFVAARWLRSTASTSVSYLPRFVAQSEQANRALNALGAIVLFLLVNIEIADYFSTGNTLTLEFSGNLARDMTYSLSWAVFATILLIVGIRQGSRGARNASLGLLMVTVFKVFLHDLWQLSQLYRVGSIFGLALVLILVSFLYQRYGAAMPNTRKKDI